MYKFSSELSVTDLAIAKMAVSLPLEASTWLPGYQSFSDIFTVSEGRYIEIAGVFDTVTEVNCFCTYRA